MADSLRTILDELGQLTFDEIALKLEANNIRGKPGIVSKCPIAKYIQQNIGHSFIEVARDFTVDRASENIYVNPMSVRLFIEKFDTGSFLQLIDIDLIDVALTFK